MPFADECEIVQRLLSRLDGAATETRQKDAIARARYWLEPNPQHLAPQCPSVTRSLVESTSTPPSPAPPI